MTRQAANPRGRPAAERTEARSPYRLETIAIKDNPGYLLKRAWMQLACSIDQQLAPFELTYPQFVILLRLSKGECSTAAELAREVGTDTGAMTRMLDRLESKGALQRVRNAADRRVINLEITDAGRDMADKAMVTAVEVLNHYFGDFSAEELALLEQMLRRIIARGA